MTLLANTFRPGTRESIQQQARDEWAAQDIEQSITLASGIVIAPKRGRAEELAAQRDAWLAERPTVRIYVHTASGDPRLPVLVRFVEGGHLITENKGRTECDALAQALFVIATEEA